MHTTSSEQPKPLNSCVGVLDSGKRTALRSIVTFVLLLRHTMSREVVNFQALAISKDTMCTGRAGGCRNRTNQKSLTSSVGTLEAFEDLVVSEQWSLQRLLPDAHRLLWLPGELYGPTHVENLQPPQPRGRCKAKSRDDACKQCLVGPSGHWSQMASEVVRGITRLAFQGPIVTSRTSFDKRHACGVWARAA